MGKHFINLLVILLAGTGSSYAQRMHHTASFRKIEANAYFRFHYDNDYFTKTDEYYSQGITLEYVHPSVKKFPLATFLYKPFTSTPAYGLGINLFGYTPTSILSDSILYGDRPFDANISLQTFLIQEDPARKRQISVALSLGIMGPAAQGYEIQYGIHKWLNNPLPHGWQYQVKNDIIVNYQVNYEKQLKGSGKHFLLNSTAEARLGTLNTSLGGGFNFMAGRFNKRYALKEEIKKKAAYYFYGQCRVNVVGYDASLQGGLFNKKSPYTIPSADLSRLTFQADAGVIINFKKFYLSYTQSFISKEFTTGKTHRWGGMSMGFAL